MELAGKDGQKSSTSVVALCGPFEDAGYHEPPVHYIDARDAEHRSRVLRLYEYQLVAEIVGVPFLVRVNRATAAPSNELSALVTEYARKAITLTRNQSDVTIPTRSAGIRTRPAAALTIIAASTFLSMSVWFSASFVIPQLTTEWNLTFAGSSLLTIAVQIGFVIGALLSAATGLADAVPSRFLIAIGAVGAALANLGLLMATSIVGAFPLRLLTGVFLACVYPPALKEISTWFRTGRGKAFGVMIGALTLGSALPHLVNSVGDIAWQTVIMTTSVMTGAGGLIILLVRSSGPYPFPRRPFSITGAVRSLRNRDIVLANIGYMGHMWELYAMWAFVGTFLATVDSITTLSNPEAAASALAFVCIGAGAIGCIVGGILSDRYGRAQSALICLICSGAAAVAVGFSGAAPLPVILALCAFWGFWIIADSAQFSALVTERADPVYVGGAVSVQLALGYLTTTVTLWLVPVLVRHFSWSAALFALAAGPIIGIAAMAALIGLDRTKISSSSKPVKPDVSVETGDESDSALAHSTSTI